MSRYFSATHLDTLDVIKYLDIEDEESSMWVPIGKHKSGIVCVLAQAPKFRDMLRKVDFRETFVFNPMPQHLERCQRLGAQRVGRVACKVGKLADIKVLTNNTTSARDLRRSFGDRWAQWITPAILMDLMRQRSIDATSRYYTGRKAKQPAKLLRTAMGADLGTVSKSSNLEASETS